MVDIFCLQYIRLLYCGTVTNDLDEFSNNSVNQLNNNNQYTCIFNLLPCDHAVYPKKYAHDFCFAVLCCGYTLTDFPISIRLTSLALLQSNDCPSASKATLMNMDKYFMWIHYERLHNHNKAKHNKTVCIFLEIYCTSSKAKVMRLSQLQPFTIKCPVNKSHLQF